MSTMDNNDNLCREGLGSYREMPSDKVWAGVTAALDADKKKRRFIIWWWTGGLGFAAVAALTGVLFFSMPAENVDAVSSSRQASTAEKFPVANNNKINNASIVNNDAAQNSTDISESASNNSSVLHTQQNHSAHTIPNKSNRTVNNNNSVSGKRLSHENIKADAKNNHPKNEIAANNVSIATIEHNNAAQENQPKEPRIEALSAAQTMNVFSLPFIEPIQKTAGPTFVKPLPFFTPLFSIQAHSGAVAYHRKEIGNTTVNNTADEFYTYQTKAKPFGWYNAVSVKAGFLFRNQLYVTAGIGYEHQRFSNRESFNIPSGTGTPIANQSYDIPVAFGTASFPLASQDFMAGAQTLQGKLIYTNHQLFFPIDIGYKFSYKRLGVNVGLTGAFHVPLSQKAIFISDAGDLRNVNVNKAAPFNFSVGMEPMLEYRVARMMGITAGGTFRYCVLNAFENNNKFSRPYVLAGNLGLRFYLR